MYTYVHILEKNAITFGQPCAYVGIHITDESEHFCYFSTNEL